jgi:Mn2+/Fe2+ NRAMP family transporter
MISGSILAFGVIVALIFQSSPVQLIVIAQALTVLVAPVLAALIIIMANRRTLMGGMRNRWWQNLLGIIGLAAVIALSVRLLVTLIGA